MTHSENPYRQEVFLNDLRSGHERDKSHIWSEHQQMQFSFLQRHGFSPSSTVLDLGCGPMRLGSVLIPHLNDGWYFGQDINSDTIIFGQEVLRSAGIPENAPYTLFSSDQFDLSNVDRSIQIAFSNSLFSHLTLNSIFAALLQVKSVLAPAGVFYSTFFAVEPLQPWLEAHTRNKWGREFETFPHQDPYHYPIPLLREIAFQAGFRLDIVDDYGHPTQTMGRFRKSRFRKWFC